jgi:hypothetical protein
MKKSVILIGILSIIALTGCSLSTAPAPTVTVTEASTTCKQLAELAHDLIIDVRVSDGFSWNFYDKDIHM